MFTYWQARFLARQPLAVARQHLVQCSGLARPLWLTICLASLLREATLIPGLTTAARPTALSSPAFFFFPGTIPWHWHLVCCFPAEQQLFGGVCVVFTNMFQAPGTVHSGLAFITHVLNKSSRTSTFTVRLYEIHYTVSRKKQNFHLTWSNSGHFPNSMIE